MTYAEAKAYISRLTHKEKVILNDFLKGLEQSRQPSEVLLVSGAKDEK